MYRYVCVCGLVQVADSYVQLVTAINNADTLVTLIVPSVIIVFSNVRISAALSQFSRDRELMLAQHRRTARTSDDVDAPAAPAVALAPALAPPAFPAVAPVFAFFLLLLLLLLLLLQQHKDHPTRHTVAVFAIRPH